VIFLGNSELKHTTLETQIRTLGDRANLHQTIALTLQSGRVRCGHDKFG
jgi:hypothetical protein